MGTVFIRSVIVYIMLLFFVKLMGKRQVGQLQVSELVSALLLSEIATMPIVEPETPLLYAVVPLFAILSLEVVFSFLIIKIPFVRALLVGRPSPLMLKGEINYSEMERSRISCDELLSELRLQGISDISQVHSAILEESGRLSVILKAEHQPLTPKDMGVPIVDDGIYTVIAADGKVREKVLEEKGLSHEWLSGILSFYSAKEEDILLLLLSDSGRVKLIKKHSRGKSDKKIKNKEERKKNK